MLRAVHISYIDANVGCVCDDMFDIKFFYIVIYWLCVCVCVFVCLCVSGVVVSL